MRVSIAMATCEGGRYLREQLDSLARQTRLPDELVISDDQSTDGTVDIARGFAAQAPFEVRIEVNPRRIGVTGNFDHALSLCTGDIVLLSDQDDVWFPSKVETILDIARGSSAACWMVDALLADASLVTTGARKMEQIRAARLPDSAMVMGCCAGFRRDLLDLLLPLPEDEPAHDTWMVQVAELLSLVERVEVPMQYYRRHGRNVSQASVNRVDRPRLGERLSGSIRRSFERATNHAGLEREHQFYASAAARLAERADQVRALAGPGADAIVARTEGRRRLLERRMSIRGQPIHRRAMRVMELWRAGAYSESGGLAGALKDALLPTLHGARRG